MFHRFASASGPHNKIVIENVPVQQSCVDIREAFVDGVPRRSVLMDLHKEPNLCAKNSFCK